MPKVARTKRSKSSIYLGEFPNETFRSDGQVLYWQSCDKSVSIDQRGQVIQHINTSKHRYNKDIKLIFQQNCISTSSASANSKSVFNDDLCRALNIFLYIQIFLFLDWKMLHLKMLWKNILVIKFPTRVHFEKMMLAGFMKKIFRKFKISLEMVLFGLK